MTNSCNICHRPINPCIDEVAYEVITDEEKSTHFKRVHKDCFVKLHAPPNPKLRFWTKLEKKIFKFMQVRNYE